ncbi:alpha/beta fold hydrolase [Photobacterium kasasachensis]|uniref:alpha/beta fold hydrolase n=1 Tax=Photobacterium kasasachensis TaxID=2910240 RepID=UPI003D132194
MKAALYSLALLSTSVCASSDNDETFFSLQEVQQAKPVELADSFMTRASDDLALAVRSYIPPSPKAVFIFYHGGGAHSGVLYNHLAVGLETKYDIAVYTPDLRGHGDSQGDRGDSPSKQRVWQDISDMIEFVKSKHPGKKVFLGGHSSGAGLVLNYSSWEERVPVEGYSFVAPYFGYKSETDREGSHYQFTDVKTSSFIINSMSGGFFSGHDKAVQFNYPGEVLDKNPKLVAYNTVNMANALTPDDPKAQIASLASFGLWMGKNDEAFDAQKTADFVRRHQSKQANSDILLVDNQNHFSIILVADDFVGDWIINQLSD